MICVFAFQGSILLFQIPKFFLYSCDCENYVQCVKYSVFGPVRCVSQCGCHTPPSADCWFSIKITLKAACLYLSHRSTPEGTQFQSAVEGAQSTRSVVSPKIGPSAWIEHPWITAVTPWDQRPVAPVANWRVSSRANSIKEILVTLLMYYFHQAVVYESTNVCLTGICLIAAVPVADLW